MTLRRTSLTAIPAFGVAALIAFPSAPAFAANSSDRPASAPRPGLTVTNIEGTAGDPIYRDLDGNGGATVGDTVGWQVTLENIGDETLRAVHVEDAQSSEITCVTTTLDPGDATLCVSSAPYKLTQNDVLRGKLTTNFNAIGKPDVGDEYQGAAGSSQLVLWGPADIAVELTAGPGEYHVGDPVPFTAAVENTGDTELTGLVVEGGPDYTCADDVLAVGATTTCVATIIATEEHAAAERVEDSVVATGTWNTQAGVGTVSDTDSASAPVVAAPVDPVKPVDPVDPGKPVDPVKPADPVVPEPGEKPASLTTSRTPESNNRAVDRAASHDALAFTGAEPAVPLAASVIAVVAGVGVLLARGIAKRRAER